MKSTFIKLHDLVTREEFCLNINHIVKFKNVIAGGKFQYAIIIMAVGDTLYSIETAEAISMEIYIA